MNYLLAARNFLFGIPKRDLDMKIKELPLSEHTQNRLVWALELAEVETVGQLLEKTESYLLRFPNVGRKFVNELKRALAVRGLRLKKE